MKLITKSQKGKLIRNWDREDGGVKPVVKLFSPVGSATWLISAMDPENEDMLFGLCDLGMGFPELGYVSLQELQQLKVPLKVNIGNRQLRGGLPIERDLYFEATHGIGAYADAARDAGAITFDKSLLDAAQTVRAA